MSNLHGPVRSSGPIHCDQAASVLKAIEEKWVNHHSGRPSLGLYMALAFVLNREGVIIDTVDGLEILEHCRRRNLKVVDILHALEEKVRGAGYLGDRLCLADFQAAGEPVYAFYDGARFKSFADLKQKAQLRISSHPSQYQPEA